MLLKGARNALLTYTSSTSQTQANVQIDPLLDSNDNDVLDGADVAQLREQICMLTQACKDD